MIEVFGDAKLNFSINKLFHTPLKTYKL